MTTYLVIQPLGDSPELRVVGPTISRHRSVKAARASIKRDVKSLQRMPGQQDSWLGRVILAREPDGGTKILEIHDLDDLDYDETL